MTQDKHTALPWGVSYLDKNGQSVIMSAHTEIATCWHHSVVSLEKEMHQNAKLICRAVNNHYQLIEALEKATDQLEKAVGGERIDTKAVNQILKRQALSNAKGE